MFLVGTKVICTITGIVMVSLSEGAEPIPFQVQTNAIGIVKSTGPDKIVADFSKYVKENTAMKGDFSKVLVNKSDCSEDN